VLHGRGRDRGQIDQLLAEAQNQRSGALVVRGEAGIGKSALLEYAAASADGFCVLRGAGVETESELPFAALHQVLHPVLEHAAEIPDRQRVALLGAFGQGPAVGAEDRFLVSLAVLSLLAEIAEAGPVLCVVDDAQWQDGASADALTFVARRIQAEGIVILFGARDDPAAPFRVSGVPELVLSGLDPAAASALLVERTGSTPADEVRDRLVADTGGNPLALAELAVSLSGRQLAGVDPLPGRLPVAGDLGEVYLERVSRLPAETQTLLLVAAAEDTGELRVVLRAAHVLGIGAEALDPAETAGLVRVESPLLTFHHPLVRSAIYRGATFQQRRAVAEALAEALAADEDPDRRAWHLGNAAVGPDDVAADALNRSAQRSGRRGAHAAAATAYDRAAALTNAPELRAGRLADAAQSAWLAGRPDRAQPLLDSAARLADAPRLRARIEHLRGTIEATCGVPSNAYAVLMAGSELITSLDPERAARMLTEAGQIAWATGDLLRLGETGRRLSELPAEYGAVTIAARLITGLGSLLDGDTATATVRLREAADLARATGEPHTLMVAAAGTMFLGEDARAIDLFTRAVTSARSEAAVAKLPALLAPLAALESWTGRFAVATSHATEGLRLAEETRQDNPAAHHRSILAWLAAVQGREQDCRDAAATALAHAIGHRLGPHAAIASWALALLDLGAGRPSQAYDRLAALTAAGPGDGHLVISVFAAADLVEVATRTGNDPAARKATDLLRAWASQVGAPWALALVARCTGLIEPDSDSHFTEALDLHAKGGRPFDTARTELLYGETLRRRRRRADARRYLTAAHETFERLGARPWADQASNELRATGVTARKRDPSSVNQLTPQELQIARLVAEGATNRAIAGQLFLSPRTVDYHLHKVFTKLGLTSRAELVKFPLDGQLT
jgi:DNA-binding NarL/FixJ family response regulator